MSPAMAIVVGTKAPNPSPWTARNRMSSTMLWDAPDRTEPAMNTTTPIKNSFFRP